MTITLNKQNIQNDINARYMMTMQDADTMPPAGERNQAISEAFSSLVALLSPIVSGITPASLSIELHSTARVAPGKDSLESAAHSFVVSSALARIYYNMRMAEQAQINAAVAKDDATAIENILFTVSRPTPWNG